MLCRRVAANTFVDVDVDVDVEELMVMSNASMMHAGCGRLR